MLYCVYVEPVLQVTGNPHTRQTSLPGKETSPIPADRSPSPARNPESKALHVKNLVRPFTLNQLKELLGKYGLLTNNGFWIDKIKSHCYVVVWKSVTIAACLQLVFFSFVSDKFATTLQAGNGVMLDCFISSLLP